MGTIVDSGDVAFSAATFLGLNGRERDATGIELGGVGLVLRTGEDVYLLAPADVREARVLQHRVPLCLQQSAGDSA